MRHGSSTNIREPGNQTRRKAAHPLKGLAKSFARKSGNGDCEGKAGRRRGKSHRPQSKHKTAWVNQEPRQRLAKRTILKKAKRPKNASGMRLKKIAGVTTLAAKNPHWSARSRKLNMTLLWALGVARKLLKCPDYRTPRREGGQVFGQFVM